MILQTEWTLVPQVLQPVWETWFLPMVDLLATMFNHRLLIYVSPVPDQELGTTTRSFTVGATC